mmetsp:Transcript_409/g.623  ORF Transcript_409/g.623 Transcript_409/m.623 type:complete len:100 (-) Transcript_409:97-396(-)
MSTRSDGGGTMGTPCWLDQGNPEANAARGVQSDLSSPPRAETRAAGRGMPLPANAYCLSREAHDFALNSSPNAAWHDEQQPKRPCSSDAPLIISATAMR